MSKEHKRTIVCGDIHGCLEEFDELVKLVGYKRGEDRLILVGDLIDRGPNSSGVVRRARELGAECTRANHEETAIRYREHEAKKVKFPEYVNPMRPRHADRLAQWNAILEDDWKWLEGLPTHIKFARCWIAVHAGARGGIAMEDQSTREMIRMRFIHKETGKMIPMENGDDPPDGYPWYEDWHAHPTIGSEQHVVYGHHVYPHVLITGDENKGLTVGIDTGCCFGGSLTAMVKNEDSSDDDFMFVNVKAKQSYSNLIASWSFDGV